MSILIRIDSLDKSRVCSVASGGNLVQLQCGAGKWLSRRIIYNTATHILILFLLSIHRESSHKHEDCQQSDISYKRELFHIMYMTIKIAKS